MSLLWGIYVGIPVCTILICSGIGVWIYRYHADVRGSRWFLAALVGVCGWMGAEIAHLVLAGQGYGVLAKALATKFALWTFVANFVFYSRFSRTDFHRHWLSRAVIAVVVAITALPTWIDPFQRFVYQEIETAVEPFTYVVVRPGLGYAIGGILVAIATAYALVVLVRYMVATPRRSGIQIGLLVVGSLSIMVAIVLGNLDVVFPLAGKTHAEFGALPAVVLVSLALFRFRLFEIRPVARNALVEDLEDPVLVLDPDRRLVDYNPASTAVWPAIDGGIGDPIDDVCPDVAADLTLCDEPSDESVRLSHVVDGSRRYYSLTVSTVHEDRSGEPELYALLFRDVTDLEESRWLLERQNDRLEQVAATISHDLRNPISVADGYAEMLEAALEDGELAADQREAAGSHLRRIRSAHDRMAEIIEDVLALAREGQAVEETEPVALSAVAGDAWSQVATRSATLVVDADRLVAADRTKLQTLLENLFRNAVEHAGEDATVTVGPHPEGFYVADDGPGIDEADADAVFEYGYSTSEEGTGLGLSIVRTIAESHGWTVDLDRPASGAQFTFRNVETDPVDDAGIECPTGQALTPGRPDGSS